MLSSTSAVAALYDTAKNDGGRNTSEYARRPLQTSIEDYLIDPRPVTGSRLSSLVDLTGRRADREIVTASQEGSLGRRTAHRALVGVPGKRTLTPGQPQREKKSMRCT